MKPFYHSVSLCLKNQHWVELMELVNHIFYTFFHNCHFMHEICAVLQVMYGPQYYLVLIALVGDFENEDEITDYVKCKIESLKAESVHKQDEEEGIQLIHE